MNPQHATNPVIEYENAMTELERLNPRWELSPSGVVAAVLVTLSAIFMFYDNFSWKQCSTLLSGYAAVTLYWRYFPSPGADERRWQEAMKVMRAMKEEIKSLKTNQSN